MFRMGQKVVRFSGGPGCVITNHLSRKDYTHPELVWPASRSGNIWNQ